MASRTHAKHWGANQCPNCSKGILKRGWCSQCGYSDLLPEVIGRSSNQSLRENLNLQNSVNNGNMDRLSS